MKKKLNNDLNEEGTEKKYFLCIADIRKFLFPL